MNIGGNPLRGHPAAKRYHRQARTRHRARPDIIKAAHSAIAIRLPEIAHLKKRMCRSKGRSMEKATARGPIGRRQCKLHGGIGRIELYAVRAKALENSALY